MCVQGDLITGMLPYYLMHSILTILPRWMFVIVLTPSLATTKLYISVYLSFSMGSIYISWCACIGMDDHILSTWLLIYKCLLLHRDDWMSNIMIFFPSWFLIISNFWFLYLSIMYLNIVSFFFLFCRPNEELLPPWHLILHDPFT